MKRNKISLYIILAINIICYIYSICINGTKALSGIKKHEIVNVGGMSSDTNITHIITSLFAHQSASHLIMNMVLLIVLGNIILDNYHILEFIITYFLAGVTSNVYMLAIINGGTALGASGCLFGLLGLMLIGALMPTKKTKKLNHIKGYVLGLVVIYIFLSIVTISNGTNIYSHIVGFIIGIFIGLVIMIINKRRDKIERVK
ncbi:rhomboid family intramembrane serine protease [Staphylococcus caprae]|uniref:rhomboid family intramembrane serine protease n=1 Tax=Staphylococcus caprae TaxID=29380 RepID=UPI0014525F2D|nr:rhomboid family intramembrane serine protease [Staphylococcus caprae]QJE26688.1 rhomboid family intramembrane serine protease [Staphylococcus caprae]